MAIQIRNWSKYQHFNRRRPPWIKLHIDLLDDKKFGRLPIPSQALLPQLWLYASQFPNGIIDEDDDQIAHRLRWPIATFDQALGPLLALKFCCYVSTPQDDFKRQGQLFDEIEKSPERHETETTPTNATSESESESEAERKKRNRGGGKIAFPKGWSFETMTDGEREVATSAKLDVKQTFEEFESYWRMRDERFNDWPQAWRNWCAKAVRIRDEKGGMANGNNDRGHRTRHVEPGRKSYVDRAREGYDRFIARRSADVHGTNGNGMAAAGNITAFRRREGSLLDPRNDASSSNGSGDRNVHESDGNDPAIRPGKPIDF